MRNLSFCLFIILFINEVSYAQKIFSAASGAWHTPQNWNPAVVTGPANDAQINQGSNAAKNTLVFSGAGRVMLGVAGTFTPSTGAFVCNSGAAQNVWSTTYNKLVLSNGTKKLEGSVHINESLMMSSGATLNRSAEANFFLKYNLTI